MITRFNDILIPVDFTANTEVALLKALRLAEDNITTIHLLHVQRGRGRQKAGSADCVRSRLDQLCKKYFSDRRNINTIIHIMVNKPVEKAIIEKAAKINAGLILIAKKNYHHWLRLLNTVVPSRVASKTRIPVLTVKPASAEQDIKTIVVPIGQEFPREKIDILCSLKKKGSVQVRLLLFREDSRTPVPASLMQVFRSLRRGDYHDIQYVTVPGKNKAKAIRDYCDQIKPDLLVVSLQSETRLGWPNKHISGAMPPDSTTQILAI